EDGDARADEMEDAEAADEFREDRQDGFELAAAGARPFEKKPLFGLRLRRLDVLRRLAGRRFRAHGRKAIALLSSGDGYPGLRELQARADRVERFAGGRLQFLFR